MRENHFIRKDVLKGLYDPSNEHDACGVGMIVNLHGTKSHELIDSALKVLENMKHRGAEGADSKTGDGAGIMIQIPHEFILLQGIPVPEKGKYGTGLVNDRRDRTRGNDADARTQCTGKFINIGQGRASYRTGYKTNIRYNSFR